MFEYLTRKKIFLLSCILSLLVLYWFYFFLYAVPRADDYHYASVAIRYGPWQNAVKDYFAWSGRLFSNYIYAFFMNGMNFFVYRIVGGLSLLTFCLTVFWGFSLFFPTLSFGRRVFSSLLIICAWLYGLDSPNDALYWMGGLTNYFIPLILYLLAVCCLKTAADEKSLSKKRAYFLLSVAAFVPASFSNEALVVTALWLFLTAGVLSGINRSPFRFYIYAAAIIVAASLAAEILAPGSYARMEISGGNDYGKFFHAVWRSLMTTLERSAGNYFASMLIPASFFIYFAVGGANIPPLLHGRSLKVQAAVSFLIGISGAWAAHFVVVYALDVGGLPPRGKIVPQTVHLIFFTLGNLYLMRYFGAEKFASGRRGLFFAVLTAWLLTACLFSREFVGSLLTPGQHPLYERMYMTRYDELKKGNGFPGVDIVSVKKLNMAPPPVADREFLTVYCDHYVNVLKADYFGIKGCLRMEEGQDGDADKNLKKLDEIKKFFDEGLKNRLKGFFSGDTEGLSDGLHTDTVGGS